MKIKNVIQLNICQENSDIVEISLRRLWWNRLQSGKQKKVSLTRLRKRFWTLIKSWSNSSPYRAAMLHCRSNLTCKNQTWQTRKWALKFFQHHLQWIVYESSTRGLKGTSDPIVAQIMESFKVYNCSSRLEKPTVLSIKMKW